jgi:conjugal transfer pilus assembly protein TrbC
MTAGAAMATLLSIVPAAHAQSGTESMAESMRKGWSTYIFVSSKMPRQSLVDLAREASQSGATLVLRGGQGGGQGTSGQVGNLFDTATIQQTIGSINQACCGEQAPGWILDPVLVDRYRVTAAPTFVIAWSTGNAGNQFTSVSGDMSLANALKFVAQGSSLASMRERAKALYAASFGGRQ